MRVRSALIAAAAVLLSAAAARAGDNDLQLWRLGHPDDITVCTKCDGTDPTTEPGDGSTAAHHGAQYRFARFASALGLALIPPLFEGAQTTGQAGFELGFSGHVATQNLLPNEWATAGTQATTAAPRALFLPTISLRKGFGGGLEMGLAASFLGGSQITALTAELRWAVLEGLEFARGIAAPDLALRLHGTRPIGTQELDLLTVGADAVLSYRLALGGALKLQPYFQFGLAMVNATTGIVDFKPATEDAVDPTRDDGVFHTIPFYKNRYWRWGGGLRLQAGAVLIGGEVTWTSGTNPIQDGDQPGGTPTQHTESWGLSGRLGLAF